MFDLTDRVAVITGAASGIGAATARVFAEAGADVAIAWFPGDPHDVEPTRAAVEERGRRLLGVFRCFRAAIPHMRRGGFGRLLATSSIAGSLQGWSEHAHYTAAKAGLVGLVRTLAVECGPWGITANCVAPGVIVTPQSSDPVNSLGPAGLEEFAKRVPVGRNGVPEDIAHAFLYLASEEAGYLPGQTLLVE